MRPYMLLLIPFLTTCVAAQAGVTTVPLNNQDSHPLIQIPAIQLGWNDIHFEVAATPGLKTDATKLKSATGTDLRWSDPVSKGGGNYTMKTGPNGTAVAPGAAAGLQLQSKTDTGWSQIKYARTQDGNTVYTSQTITGETLLMMTGNAFPVGLSAIINLTNGTSSAIAGVTLTVDTSQTFTEIGGSEPGYGVPGDGTYFFDNPLEPDSIATLYWTYNEFSATPENDTEVTITASFTEGLMSLASGRGTSRLSRLSAPRAKVPSLVLREIKAGGFGNEIALSTGGLFRFVSGTGVVTTTSGTKSAGQPYLDASGDLRITLLGASTEKSAWTLSDLQIDLSNTPPGPVRLFIVGKGAKMGTIVGLKL